MCCEDCGDVNVFYSEHDEAHARQPLVEVRANAGFRIVEIDHFRTKLQREREREGE